MTEILLIVTLNNQFNLTQLKFIAGGFDNASCFSSGNSNRVCIQSIVRLCHRNSVISDYGCFITSPFYWHVRIFSNRHTNNKIDIAISISLLCILISACSAKPIIFILMTNVTIPMHVLSMTSVFRYWHYVCQTLAHWYMCDLCYEILNNTHTSNLICLAIYGHDCTKVKPRPTLVCYGHPN